MREVFQGDLSRKLTLDVESKDLMKGSAIAKEEKDVNTTTYAGTK